MQSTRQLLYRWFVQYNPAYLLSAAFVFAGCFLWSKGVVHEATLTSTFGISLVAEIYAVALIGGAALLTRIGQRRPAVLLSLIFVVYQWDTTLHTEACAYLGSIGAVASLVWLAIFIAKFFGIAWALRIRFDRGVISAAALAALGLVIAPRVLPVFAARDAGALLAAWIFVLISLYDGAGISSVVPLDAWGQTVLRRTNKAAWLISGVLIGLHAAMWCANAEVSLAPLILSLPLLAIRRMRDEKLVWVMIFGVLGFTFAMEPGAFFVVSILTAGSLCLRVVAPKFSSMSAEPRRETRRYAPYRTNMEFAEGPEKQPISFAMADLSAGERIRCWSGALFATYLGVWSMCWWYGPFPHHLAWLDVALTLVVALSIWRTRARLSFGAPLAITYGHLIVQARLIPVPASSIEWGGAAIVFGFVLLGASLLASYLLRSFEAPHVPAEKSLDG